jgi:hypothetical protein
MRRIVVGYGDYKDYALAELPEEHLQELSRHYPLECEKYDPSDSRSLLITVAIHEEIQRRKSGGERKKRIPTLRELATQLVAKGFHQLTKQHHPDRNGTSEAQRRLNQVREHLMRACGQIAEEDQDAIIIHDPNETVPEVNDEDIPF